MNQEISGASDEASQRSQPGETSWQGVKPKKIKVEQLSYTLRCKHMEVALTASKIDSDWADLTNTNLGPFNYEELHEETFTEE